MAVRHDSGSPRPGREPVTASGSRGERQPEELARLLNRVARGDDAAFARIYDQIAGPVYGLVSAVLSDPSQAEEVTRQVLVEVWRTASRFDAASGSATAWMLAVAHRRAVERLRSAEAGARRKRTAAALPAGSGDETADPVTDGADRRRARRGLDGLTGPHNEPITLAYYGGHTYPQVAGLLAVPPGTVRTRIRDGLLRLRDGGQDVAR